MTDDHDDLQLAIVDKFNDFRGVLIPISFRGSAEEVAALTIAAATLTQTYALSKMLNEIDERLKRL